MERKQFTFYHSFREALAMLKDPLERVQAYDMIADYALDGIEPQLDKLSDIVQVVFMLVKPTLDSSKRKAMSGRKGGQSKQTVSNEEANCKQTASEKEKELELDKEIEIELETETETETDIETKTKKKGSRAGFEWFWSVYPKQIGKEEAYKAFCGVTEPVNVLVEAVKRQKESLQWQKEGGRYIPNPTNWLTGKRWTDNLPTANDSAPLSDLDLAAIERMMSGKGFT